MFISVINPLNAELNPICHLLALLGSHPILHIGRIWVKLYKQLYEQAFILQTNRKTTIIQNILIKELSVMPMQTYRHNTQETLQT